MFEDYLFIILFVTIPFIWHFMLKAAGLSLMRFSIPVVVLLFFYVHQYVGIPVLYFQIDDYRYFAGVNDKFIVMRVFFYTVLTMSLMIVGCLFGREILGVLHNPIPLFIR